MLGREAQEAGVGVDRLLPEGGAAAELAGAVIEAPGHADADAVGDVPALPAPVAEPISSIIQVRSRQYRGPQTELGSAPQVDGNGLAPAFLRSEAARSTPRVHPRIPIGLRHQDEGKEPRFLPDMRRELG